MQRIARLFLTTVLSFTFAFVSLCEGASAKDLEMLARLLVPAYIAQNFTVLCIKQDARFFSGMKIVSDFTEHVKQEVTNDLPEQEAAEVRIMAADAARDVATKRMESVAGVHFNTPTESLRKWCDGSAKPIVLEIVRQHQVKHGEFEMRVAAAKH